MIVLFKKGDPSMPANYRPIAIIPILYKLFSRMLCNRVGKTIVGQQSVDQAAYRPGFSTDDHLFCLMRMVESSSEWNIPLWLGLVDFEKAFDTVEHGPLWDALEELGVESQYVDVLKMLYRSQACTVLAGAESRAFSLERGVKQGDPLSSFLFIAVMEVVFRRLKARWNTLNRRRSGPYYGIVVDSPGDPLTNLRFADDVLLFASCRADIGKMISDLHAEASKFGLKVHAGKTRILTTDSSATRRPCKLTGHEVQVLPAGESEKYLGRKLSLDDFHGTELDNRLAMCWAAFFKFKAALCNRCVPIRLRLALFETAVSPSTLYSCAT